MSEQEASLGEYKGSDETPSSGRNETLVGGLPSEWDVVWLNEICSINPDGFSEEDWPEETFEYISLSNVSEGAILKSETTAIEDAPSRAQRGVKKGDILVGTVRPNQVSHGIVTEDHDGKICSSGFGVLRPQANLNAFYLLQEVLSRRFFRQMEAYVAGSGYPAVKIGDLRKHRIAVPPLEEQRKIASVLYAVDQSIQKAEEILTQIKRSRKGVVHTAFRRGTKTHKTFQETASGKYPDDWDIVKFENLIKDTRYGTDNKSNTNGDGYPTFRIPNVVQKRISTDDLKHTPLDDDEFERLLLQADDILVIRTNGNPNYVGRCATVSDRDDPFVFASYLIRIQVDESQIRPAFVREFLNSQRGRSEMSGWIRSSAGNYNLSVEAIEKFDIPVPDLDEQDTIVEKIEKVENTLRVNEQGRDRLKRLKQGLMQDLLSGEVRTHDKDIEILDEVIQFE